MPARPPPAGVRATRTDRAPRFPGVSFIDLSHKPTGLLKLLLKAPTWLFRAHLGFVFGKRFVMIEHKGRRSGRLYRTVVEVAGRIDGELICTSGTGPRADWYRNIVEGGLVAVWLGARRHQAQVRFLTPEESSSVMADYESAHPGTAQNLYDVMGVSYDGTDADRERLMIETPMVGFTLDGAASTSTDSARLAETVEYVAIRRLQNAYADIVTRQAWTELADVMHPDCELALDLGDRSMTIEGPDAIGAFIGTQLEQFSFFEFVILNTVIDVGPTGSTATARMYMQELRQNVSDGRRTNAFGVYHDKMVRNAEGDWRFLTRRYGSYSRTDAVGPENEQVVFDLPVIALDSI